MRGPYCHECGAHLIESQNLSLRRFAGEAVEEITDLEHSKLLRTLRALFLRPGFLTAEYFSDRRQRYLKPLTLVLGVFALSLFVFSANTGVSMFDSRRQATTEVAAVKRMGAPENPRMIKNRVEAASAARSMPADELYDSIDDAWARNASLVQIPQILLLAIVLKLAYWRARRHFAEHLIFAMHFMAFSVLAVVLMWPLYYVVGINLSTQALTVAAVKYVIDMTYLFLALRRYYGGAARTILIRVPLVFVGYMLIYGGTNAVAMLFAIESVLR